MKTRVIARALLLGAMVSLVACSDKDTTTAPQPDAGEAGTPTADIAPAAVTTAAGSEAAPPAKPVPEHLRQGQQLYEHWCSACHARGPGHPGTQALEARYGGAMPGALEDRTNLTPEFVAVFVRNGISIMPFFRKTEINDEELAAIGAYLAYTPPEQAPQAP
jgi:mono/diheme cytochrome c family protein